MFESILDISSPIPGGASMHLMEASFSLPQVSIQHHAHYARWYVYKVLLCFVLLWLSEYLVDLQYIPRNMHTVFALLCFVVVIHWLIFPYPSGLLHWHCGNLTIAPVPAKQPWWIWINTLCEFIMNDCITTTKQSTTKPCAYFLAYTVHESFTHFLQSGFTNTGSIIRFIWCQWRNPAWYGQNGPLSGYKGITHNKIR